MLSVAQKMAEKTEINAVLKNPKKKSITVSAEILRIANIRNIKIANSCH